MPPVTDVCVHVASAVVPARVPGSRSVDPDVAKAPALSAACAQTIYAIVFAPALYVEFGRIENVAEVIVAPLGMVTPVNRAAMQ